MKWNPFKTKQNLTRPRSELHLQVREELTKLFPYHKTLEEVKLPGKRLYVDFLIPNLLLAVECNGRQHFEYIPHFHKSKLDFLNSQKRDREKRQWLVDNGYTLITINYNEEREEWQKKLRQAQPTNDSKS